MENIEKQTSSAEVITENDIRDYLEKYVSDAEAQEDEEGKKEYTDLGGIKSILLDVDGGNYESALVYIEGEIKRMEDMKEGWDSKGWGWEHEEAPYYLKKLNRMKDYIKGRSLQ